MRRGLIVRQQEPFSVRLKNFYEVTQARALLGPKFAKSLSHEPDGLIFQPSLSVSFVIQHLLLKKLSNFIFFLHSHMWPVHAAKC